MATGRCEVQGGLEPVCRVTGLLLAAGRGRRAGGPKALRRDATGVPWVLRAVDVLMAGGCDDVIVVVGAESAAVRAVLEQRQVAVVEAVDWAQGMGASLLAGLVALADVSGTGAPRPDDSACVHLVDLPDVGADVIRRLVPLARGRGSSVLARAVYAGVPGHPVLLGRAHWAAICVAAQGDRGARDYLASHRVELVECADLASGVDVDGPGDPAQR